MERRGINHYHILTFHARLTHHQHPCVCGILPKNCRVVPSPLDTRTAPCDTWHCSFHPDGNSHSFHPDIPHPEFFPADIPPGHLTSGILLRLHSTRMPHIRNSARPTFYLIRVSHIRNSPPPPFHPDASHLESFSADIPPGCLASKILLRRHSTRMSHIRNSSPRCHSTRTSYIRNSSPPTFHPDISHPEFFFAAIPPEYLTSGILSGRRSTFFGYLTSGILFGRRSPFFFILRAFS